jgi:hypothetical protein
MPNSAVVKIANAVAKIGAWVPEMKLSENHPDLLRTARRDQPP